MHADELVKKQFDEARRDLIERLSIPDNADKTGDMLAALNRMNQAFTKLLVSTMVKSTDVPEADHLSQSYEVSYAHAINASEDWETSDWRVVYIDGRPVDQTQAPLSVREYTQQMTGQGWKTFSPTGSTTISSSPPQEQAFYQLFFYRASS